MAPAKKTTKTTTTKKAAPKKTVAKAAKKASTSKPIQTKGMTMAPIAWIACVFLLGGLVGSFLAEPMMMEKFDEDKAMVVVGDKTWIPVKGKPIELMVLNDRQCTSGCDTTQAIAALKQNISPALIVTEVDVTSEEGQALIQSFDLVSVPQYFFGEGIESLGADDGSKFIDNLPVGVLTEKDDLYHLNGAATGFRPGKFIKAPEFADLDTEPKLGTGPVRVVEFTDYQCPFCKRLYDQNKELIAELVAANKITYIVKDFPLNFHLEAKDAHKAANCVLRESGQDDYWSMNAEIFRTQKAWSGKGAEARTQMIALADNMGIDITSCMSDPAIEAEMQADLAEGSRFGVSGTPALFIGTQMMPGAIGPDVFRAAVDQEL